MLLPKIKIEKCPLRNFFDSDPFLIKDHRVAFSPNRSDHGLGLYVPTFLNRTKDTLSLPVFPHVTEGDSPKGKVQSCH